MFLDRPIRFVCSCLDFPRSKSSFHALACRIKQFRIPIVFGSHRPFKIVEGLSCFDAFVWVIIATRHSSPKMLGEPAIASLLMTAATYLVRRGSGEETRGLEAIVARP